jgi:hypothetical protein
MSSSIRDKPFADVLEEVRSFGRDNSGALIAGSVLAGLALGRFVKSSSPNTRATGEDEPSDGLGAGFSTSPDTDQGRDVEGGVSP